MLLSDKRYTKEGRDRYGSAIFINDVSEDWIDTVPASRRDQSILLVFLLLLIIKILSANYLGLMTTIPVYYFMYFLTKKRISLKYTKHRLLISESYMYPKIVKMFGFYLLASLLLISLRLVLFGLVVPEKFRLDGIKGLFDLLGFSSIVYYQFRSFYLKYKLLLIAFDTTLTILCNIWYGTQFFFMKYNFKEINYAHITEQLTRWGRKISFLTFSSWIVLYLIVQSKIVIRFSLLLLIIFLIGLRLLPGKRVAILSYFGPTSRLLAPPIIVEPPDFSNLKRATAAVFGWINPLEDEEQPFPLSLIPSEEASEFETGQQTFLKTALEWANLQGALISTTINIIVIISLYNFAVKYLQNQINTVIFIGVGLLGFSIVFGVVMHAFNAIRIYTKPKEKLMIGRNFIGRYIEPSLWIIKGNKMEGTKLQRGISQAWVRYDKVRGLVVDWQRMAFIVIIGAMVLAISIWNYLGAINLAAIPLLLPSILKFAFQFLVNKANAELSFFIISGYVIWVLWLFLFPTYYSRTHPTLYIDLEYSSVTPIILKDFSDHKDASLQFTRSLINSSRSPRRKSQGRPGAFYVEIKIVESTLTQGERLDVYAGPHQRLSSISLPMDIPALVFPYLLLSGKQGYPSVDFKIDLIHAGHILQHLEFEVDLLYTSSLSKKVDFGIYGAIQLEIEIVSQKS